MSRPKLHLSYCELITFPFTELLFRGELFLQSSENYSGVPSRGHSLLHTYSISFIPEQSLGDSRLIWPLMPLRLLFRQWWLHRCHSVCRSGQPADRRSQPALTPSLSLCAQRGHAHRVSHVGLQSFVTVWCVWLRCVWQCVLCALCCCCARVGLRVQASVNSLFYTFLHAELLWLPSHCQCVKTANEREREREKEKVAELKLFIVASHPHITLLLSLYLSHYLCLSLNCFYTCI